MLFSIIVIETIIVWVMHVLTYISVSGIFFLIDDLYYHTPYKCKTSTSEMIMCVGVNLLIALPCSLMTIPFYYTRGVYRDEYYYFATVIRLILAILVEDILFYSLHKMIHRPSFYVSVHKKHHLYDHPFGFTAIYCTKTEHVVANLFPVFAVPFIVGLPWYIVKLWVLMSTVNTITAHSGYWFSEFHDLHHRKFQYNYGVFGFMDKLFSTYKITGEPRQQNPLAN